MLPCVEIEKAFPHMQTLIKANRLAIARQLCANLALAHFAPEGESTFILPKPRRMKKVWTFFCQECNVQYCSTAHNSKFCSEKCRNKKNIRATRRRKKISPAKYQALRRERNIAWCRFHQGVTDVIPVLRGRHTKVQVVAIEQLRHLKRKRRART